MRKYAKADLNKVNYDADDYTYCGEAEANLITSTTDLYFNKMHMPVLDIDVPHQLVASSTPGHSHLYIDVLCWWNDYVDFLHAAEKIGLLEPGYVSASIARGFTAVRKPGIYKNITDK